MFHPSCLVDLRCPHCQIVVATLPMGICSWLGPATYSCQSCGSPYDSGRLEWDDMPMRSKIWYVAVSLLYVCVLGGLGGLSIAGAVHFLKSGPWKSDMPVGTVEQKFGTIASAILILVCQVGRVHRSRQRTGGRTSGRAEIRNQLAELPSPEMPFGPVPFFCPISR